MQSEAGRSARFIGTLRTVFLVAKLPCRLRFSAGRLGLTTVTGLSDELEVVVGVVVGFAAGAAKLLR